MNRIAAITFATLAALALTGAAQAQAVSVDPALASYERTIGVSGKPWRASGAISWPTCPTSFERR